MIKKLLSIIVCVCLLIGSMIAQVTNSNINFQVTSLHYTSSADGDDFATEGEDEIVIRTRPTVNGTTYDLICKDWTCNAPCNSDDNTTLFVSMSDQPENSNIALYILAYESDNPDVCNWYTNDQLSWQGSANIDQGGVVKNQGNPNVWGTEWGLDNSEWILPNSTNFDMGVRSIWRYSHGDTFSDPLSFGDLAANSSVSHINSNATAPNDVQVGAVVGYTDQGNNGSADVYYSFTLTEPATVSISTDNEDTNFDTFLNLWDGSSQAWITDNDDGGTGTTSIINRILCAGDYVVGVEGYDVNQGVFGLSISSTPISIDVNPTIVATNCEDNSGSISIEIGGGLEPYTYLWSNNATTNIISDLGEGSFSVTVTDACGSTLDVSNLMIENTDNEVPVMVCMDQTFDIIEGETITITAADLDNGSTDVCGIDMLSISQTSFTDSDVGANAVILTGVDVLGNSATCAAIVTINVLTDTKEIEGLNKWEVYPNPVSNQFTLDLQLEDFDEKTTLTVTDVYGRVMVQQAAQNGIQTIDVSDWSSALYLLQVRKGAAVKSERILIQR